MCTQLSEGSVNEYAMLDATIVKAYQHSAGKKGSSHWTQQRWTDD